MKNEKSKYNLNPRFEPKTPCIALLKGIQAVI